MNAIIGRAPWGRMVACFTVALLPSVALLLIEPPRFDAVGSATYLRHREIWGGNPSEVFSHFLDLVLMTGNVAMLGALLVLEVCFCKQMSERPEQPSYVKVSTVLSLSLSGLLALWLDGTHGEGTILLVYPVGFLPVLIASRRLLRRLAERVEWRVRAVIIIAVVHTLVHAALQYIYEPSITGAPNHVFLPLWLASFAFWWWDARMRAKRTAH